MKRLSLLLQFQKPFLWEWRCPFKRYWPLKTEPIALTSKESVDLLRSYCRKRVWLLKSKRLSLCQLQGDYSYCRGGWTQSAYCWLIHEVLIQPSSFPTITECNSRQRPFSFLLYWWLIGFNHSFNHFFDDFNTGLASCDNVPDVPVSGAPAASVGVAPPSSTTVEITLLARAWTLHPLRV